MCKLHLLGYALTIYPVTVQMAHELVQTINEIMQRACAAKVRILTKKSI